MSQIQHSDTVAGWVQVDYIYIFIYVYIYKYIVILSEINKTQRWFCLGIKGIIFFVHKSNLSSTTHQKNTKIAHSSSKQLCLK